MTTSPSIPEYYSGRSVFITGATGFFGKVLIEKLLRSCPGIREIYCLVRPKKGQAGSDRLKAMFETALYDTLRAEQPNFAAKVVTIHGDVLEPGLGISEEDLRVLTERVHIIIHSAATVKFNEHLRLALEMNVIGVQKVVKLAKMMKKLEVFVHVSTAYANCDRSRIEEVIYPPPVDPQKLISASEWMTDDMMEKITPELIGDKPNTYTFTKQLAETLVVQEARDLPLVIVRPSITTATWQEPIPGWIDNINGPGGFYVAYGKGILRSMKADYHTIADLIPVDLPVNLIIASAWHKAVVKPEDLIIYQITTGTLNPFTWGEMEDVVIRYFKQNPLEECFRRPKFQRVITTSSFLHNNWILGSHLVPAYLVDLVYRLIGKRPRMVQIYKKLHRHMQILEYFTVRDWEWSHANMDMLKSYMTSDDQKKFYFDPRVLHWQTYIHNYCHGTKTYFLNEQPSGLPAARAHLKKLRNIRYLFNTVLLVVLWRLLIARSSLARNSWSLIISLVSKFVRFFSLTSTMARS